MSAVDSNIIIACATVIAALLGLIGGLLGKILGNTKRTHEQVANNHVDDNGDPINMRDDLDEKFEGLATLVKGVAETQTAQRNDINGLRVDVRQIHYDQTEDRKTVAHAARTAEAAARKAAKATEDAVLALERTGPLKPKHPTQGESNV